MSPAQSPTDNPLVAFRDSPPATKEKPPVHRERDRWIAAYLTCCGFPCTDYDGTGYIFKDSDGKVAMTSYGHKTNETQVDDKQLRKELSRLKRMADRWEHEHNPPVPKQRGPFRINLPADITFAYPVLRDAVYFVIWLLDKVTVEYWETSPPKATTQRIGVVLGGKPLTDEEIARDFEVAGKDKVDKKTVRNWRKVSCSVGMVRADRTPRGMKYAVVDTMKYPNTKPKPKLPDWAKLK